MVYSPVFLRFKHFPLHPVRKDRQPQWFTHKSRQLGISETITVLGKIDNLNGLLTAFSIRERNSRLGLGTIDNLNGLLTKHYVLLA